MVIIDILFWLFLIVVIMIAIVSLSYRWILPLFFNDKWNKKKIKVILNKKLTITEILNKYSEIKKEQQKEEKRLLRKEKLDNLKNNN